MTIRFYYNLLICYQPVAFIAALIVYAAFPACAQTSYPPEQEATRAQKISSRTPPLLEIPFRYQNGFIVVDLKLGGYYSASFIFDTGSSFTILTNHLVVPLLTNQQGTPIRLIGSDLVQIINGRLFRHIPIQVGSFTFKNLPLVVIRDGYLEMEQVVGDNISGILGTSSFGAYALTIDYRRQILSFSKYKKPHRKALIVDGEVRQGKFYFDAAVSYHQDRTDSVRLLVDSGANLHLMLNTSEIDSTIYPKKIIPTTFGLGLGGELNGFIGRSDKVVLGAVSYPNLPTHFQILPDSTYRAVGKRRNGIVGNQLLDKYLVTIDYPAEKMYLLPRYRKVPPFRFDRSGLRIVRSGDNFRDLLVHQVLANSPAARAGIQPGDKLLRLNGISTFFRTAENVERRLKGKVGKQIRLRVLRDDQVLTFKFQLEELI